MVNQRNTPSGELVSAQEYLNQAQLARENGDFFDALHLCDLSMLQFQSKENDKKVSETQSSRGLTLKKLFEKTRDLNFGIKAKNSQDFALEILQNNGIHEQYKALYELGKTQQALGEEVEAIENYKAAIENFEEFPGQYPYADSVVSEMRSRLFALEFQRGNDEAYGKFEEALEKLRQAENPDAYTKKVWLSGAYIHGADAWKVRTDKQKAMQLLRQAREVLGEDKNYPLRRGQIETIASQVS
jgi:tetratricopeptide (TPR) repeat protein